jgi:peptidoglycan/LPS O-acetylase OafA/YrhL
MGVAAYHYCAVQRLSQKAGWALFTVPLVLAAAYQMAPHSPVQPFQNITLDPDRFWSLGQDYLLAVLFSAHLIGFVAVSSTFAPWLERNARFIRWIGGATFSIYLAHLPIMYFLAATSPWPNSSPSRLALLLGVTPLLCVAFAEISERRKGVWQRLIAGGLRLIEIPLQRWHRSAHRH